LLYNSYASGKKPWKNGEDGYERQSYSDGKLEIVGFHTADFVSSNNLFVVSCKLSFINSYKKINVHFDL
jgi:hypothetical protein